VQTDFHFTTFHILQSKDHILDNFAIVIIDTALLSKAVVLAWLYPLDYGAICKAGYIRPQGFYVGRGVKYCISHFVIFAKSVTIIHSLQLERK